MADSVFENLKRQQARKSNLTETITVQISSEELAILEKKADAISMSKEELLREYILSTQALKNETKSKPKSKPKGGE
jgi:hypothetical protein